MRGKLFKCVETGRVDTYRVNDLIKTDRLLWVTYRSSLCRDEALVPVDMLLGTRLKRSRRVLIFL